MINLFRKQKTQAIRLHYTGGPDVLSWDRIALPDPGPGEAQVRHSAIGVNFIDVYFRTGLYHLKEVPSPLGVEGAGIVTAIGPGVTEVQVGDRVAYAGGPVGAYAEMRNIPAHRLVPIPDGIDDRTAAAVMLKGMTAQALLRQTFPVAEGDTILVHAAAGGVGLLMCQWARALGVTVIGTVGSEEKAELARQNGCTHTVDYTREDFVERVRTLTDGQGVPVVYDSVGQATLFKSMDCLQPRGLLVSFGQSSGPVPPIPLAMLAEKGSLFITRPTLFNYIAKREELLQAASDVFEQILAGRLKIAVNQTYALKDASIAHADLEARRTTGSSLLIPQPADA